MMEVDVETTFGPVGGTREQDVCVFRGIPYARPPVEALRFRPPEPPGTWTEPRDAKRFGSPAPQNRDALDAYWGGRLAPGDEDCLTLNVWTPAPDGRRRPVMVWIHGGAFLTGSGKRAWYDGRSLVRRGDIVLVTINYRLGVLGFLDLSEVDGEANESSANHGLIDQIAALRWVRDNIERFGGDPQNVTVFGESAGGISISCLLAMPKARGLFHRAIVMSGGPNLVRSRATSRAVARAFLRAAGLRTLDEAKRLPVKALLKAQARLLKRNDLGGDAVFGPVVDGRLLPEPPLHAIRSGSGRDVVLLVGTTRDEARLWSLYFPIIGWARPRALERILKHAVGDRWREVVHAYARSRPGERAGHLTLAINGDLLFRMPAVRLAEAQAAHRPSDTRMYLFAWSSQIRGGRLGSPHAVELPFVYGNMKAPGAEWYTGRGGDRQTVSNLMQDAWIAFARSGDPNHPGLPGWLAYRPESRATLVFDVTPSAIVDPQSEERTVWDSVPFDGVVPAIEQSLPSSREIFASILPRPLFTFKCRPSPPDE